MTDFLFCLNTFHVMDFNDQHNDMSMLAQDNRPPQHNPSNISSGYGQMYGGDGNDSDGDAHHQHTQTLLDGIMKEQARIREEISDDGRSSSDGDEGLEDHQRSQHIDAADLGHFRVVEVKRLVGHHHHHHCNCPICPYRIEASINEWRNAGVGPETPESMYPEQSSEEMSMASSWFAETRPQTPAILAETGSWRVEDLKALSHSYEDYNYVWQPLRLVPHQLDACIPEESEPIAGTGL